MAFYINIIKMILLCLTIYLTQTVTALSDDELYCCIKMDDYCSSEDPIDDFDDEAVNNGHQPSEELLLRWQNLTINDCAKSEVLKFKSNPDRSPDPRFEGNILVYRNEILGSIVFGNFREPAQFCEDQYHGTIYLQDCIRDLEWAFGNNLFTIHANAVHLYTIGQYGENSFEANYMREIAGATQSNSGWLDPFFFCSDNNQGGVEDDQSLSYLDSSSSSAITYQSNYSTSNYYN